MTFHSPELEKIDHKDIGRTHELHKLRNREDGLLMLILTAKGTSCGAVFGGHNRDVIGRYPAMIEEYFRKINSITDFHIISAGIREEIQRLIEEDKI